MRDALNYFLPIVEDDMNVSLNAGNTDIYSSITSNGYYGFQPAIEKCKEEGSEEIDMLMQPCGMEFNTASLPLTAPGQRATVNRKRTWEYGADTAGLKRRREDEPIPNLPVQVMPKCINVKQPTHNMPDIPRCIMGHYM